MREFALVMQEWDFLPFRLGKVRPLTQLEALERWMTSRYSDPDRKPCESCLPLARVL